MIFPTDPTELARRVTYVAERCLSTRDRRDRTYQWREKNYLFGTAGAGPADINELESHIDLVSSFLYAPDHAFYHITADAGARNFQIDRAIALQDDFNDDFQSSGMSDSITDAVQWSLVFDTMIPKIGWNRARGEPFIELIRPHNFGVYRESITDLDSQPAFAHTYFVEYQMAVAKLMVSGHKDKIDQVRVTHADSVSPMPEMLQRMIISGSTGAGLSSTIFGQINPDLSPTADYQPQSEVPVVQFTEVYAWDDTFNDYRTFHLLEPNILVGDSAHTIAQYKKANNNKLDIFGRLEKLGIPASDCNLFFPGEHPFSKIQPYGKDNYFWGKAHIDTLIPLQQKLLTRLDQIDDMLDRQADPARVGSGFSGLTEEKMAAFGGAGTYLFDSIPQAKVEEFKPDMPPDIFREYEKFESMFLKASGLTEVISGHSEKGVRSHQHSADMKKSGSGRIKKAALKIEAPLNKIGDVGLKLKMAHDGGMLYTAPVDGEPKEFHAADVGRVKMRVDGHSHSPLFGDEARQLAIIYRKFNTIDDEDFIRMTNPPMRDALLHSLRQRNKRRKEAMAKLSPAERQKLLTQGGKGKKK